MNHRRRSRPGRVVAAAVSACVVAFAMLAAPSSAEPGGQDPKPSEDPVLVSMDQVRAVAEPLAGLYDQKGFGRVSLDFATREVHIAWNGTPPEQVIAAEGVNADGVRVVLESVPFSDQELTSKATTLIDLGRLPGGIPVQVVTKRPDLSGLVAEVTAPDLKAAGAVQEVANTLTKLVGVPVDVQVGQELMPQTRRNDSAPWQGGGQLRFPANGNFCTSGFAVLTSGGAGRLLTAGHCNQGAGSRVNDGAGDQIAAAGTSQFAGNYDSLLIDPSASPATIGKVFGGPWDAGTGHNRYQFHVGGAAPPSVGDTVCVSGANSGEHCNREITDTGVTLNCYGYTCTGFIYRGSGVTTVGGDSGAPVYVMRADGRVGARGIHSGGLNTVTCPTDTAVDPGGNCSSRSFAIGIHQLTDRWKVIVEQD